MPIALKFTNTQPRLWTLFLSLALSCSQFTINCCLLLTVLLDFIHFYTLHAKIHQFLGSRLSRKTCFWSSLTFFYFWSTGSWLKSYNFIQQVNRDIHSSLSHSQNTFSRNNLIELAFGCDCVTGKIVVCVFSFFYGQFFVSVSLRVCFYSFAISLLRLSNNALLLLFHFRCVRCVFLCIFSLPLHIWDPLTPTFSLGKNRTFYSVKSVALKPPKFLLWNPRPMFSRLKRYQNSNIVDNFVACDIFYSF